MSSFTDLPGAAGLTGVRPAAGLVMVRGVAGAALLCTLMACSPAAPSVMLERLQPCARGEGPTGAYCGSLDVYENRTAAEGRRLSLAVVVLPAVGPRVEPDPLVFLAGGPGQGAAEMAPVVRDLFPRVQRDRDIILVDQRGTGRSHPLECEIASDTFHDLTAPEEEALARLRACLEGYDADVRFYTTSIAMDDLDDVRAWLGYERLNLYGGSYGTRAALVYIRQHESRVRSAVLDGVAPPDMRLPIFVARDAQRALDRLLADCESDDGCRQRYPALGDEVRALLARLERTPAAVRLVHPRTGLPEETVVEARVVAGILFSALYSPQGAALVPMIVERAAQDDYQPLMALAFAGEAAAENMSRGMQLSVLCSEDVGRSSPEDAEAAAAGSVFGSHLLPGLAAACEFWPRGDVEPSFYEPVVSDVPTLILSGDLDPITPPSWGDAVAAHLPRSRHIVLPAAGHGVVATPCGGRLLETFLAQGSAETLDDSCVTAARRPPFFLTPSGPDPGWTGRRDLP